jgi:hypothetical protein
LPEADQIYALYAHPTQWSRGLGRALMAATLPADLDSDDESGVILSIKIHDDLKDSRR